MINGIVHSENQKILFNAIQDGLFQGQLADEGWVKKAPLPNICHIYPTMFKLGTVIPYLKKIHKTYKSRNTPFEFC